MNYLIFDTEKTYNYGYILMNDKGGTLLKRNIVVTNNFENRNIIGENTYKTKKKYYEADPNACFISSSEAAAMIVKDLSQVDYILAHNCSEDRRQLELLHQQTGVNFPQIPFYDTINLVKIFFPQNIQTSLEAVVNDISDSPIQQTHTALQDCELLEMIISPILPYLGYFIEYQEIFAHDNDYEITQKVLSNLDKILPLPKKMEDIQTVLGIESRGDKTKLTNFFNKTSQNYNFWNITNKIVDKGTHFDTVKILSNLMKALPDIKNLIIQSCSKYTPDVATIEPKEDLSAYKKQLEKEYQDKLNTLKDQYGWQMLECEEEIRNLKNEVSRLSNSRRRARPDVAAVETALVRRMIANFNTLSHGSIFNKNARFFKKCLKKRDAQALFDMLLNI